MPPCFGLNLQNTVCLNVEQEWVIPLHANLVAKNNTKRIFVPVQTYAKQRALALLRVEPFRKSNLRIYLFDVLGQTTGIRHPNGTPHRWGYRTAKGGAAQGAPQGPHNNVTDIRGEPKIVPHQLVYRRKTAHIWGGNSFRRRFRYVKNCSKQLGKQS